MIISDESYNSFYPATVDKWDSYVLADLLSAYVYCF